MSTLQNSINANASTPLPTVDGGTGVSNPTAHGILVAEGASAFNPITLTNGQLLIGSTGNDPVAASLTAGSGVTITPGAGSITIAASGGGSGFTIVAGQVFASSGTYTPTSGMKYCVIYACGGGGGGAGVTGFATNASAGGGGGGGGTAVGILSAATVGASLTVTIGAGGAGGTGGASTGAAGSATTVGSTLLSGSGGGGAISVPIDSINSNYTGNGGIGSSGGGTSRIYSITGGDATPGTVLLNTGGTTGGALPGQGGASYFSGTIQQSVNDYNNPLVINGANGSRGSGGGGASAYWATGNGDGGTGGNGYVYIQEFI